MALDYTGLDSVIGLKMVKESTDNIYNRMNGFISRLYKKRKHFNADEIAFQIEYDNISGGTWGADMQPIALEKRDFMTRCKYAPKFLRDSLVISKKQELLANSPEAALNIVKSAMKNLEKGMMTAFVDALWVRPAATTGAQANSLAMHSIPFLVNDGTGAVGAITPADFTNWVSNRWTTASLGGDLTSESALMDPTSVVFILKLLQKGIAKTKNRSGEQGEGVVCLVSQYLWDLIELILDPQKTGSALDEDMGNMGFSALKYRKMIIMVDDDMIAKQTTDTDGEMYFINEDYVDMNFHTDGDMQSEDFIKGTNLLAATKLFFSYGNLSITNRSAHVKIVGIRSPRNYITANSVNAIE